MNKKLMVSILWGIVIGLFFMDIYEVVRDNFGVAAFYANFLAVFVFGALVVTMKSSK